MLKWTIVDVSSTRLSEGTIKGNFFFLSSRNQVYYSATFIIRTLPIFDQDLSKVFLAQCYANRSYASQDSAIRQAMGRFLC